MTMLDIRRYSAAEGDEPLTDWLASLRDLRARARIETRFARLALGNFGDSKSLRDGVHELRIDIGPGYRIYYARHGHMIVLLLCGGDKRTQETDINRAVTYWQDFKRRQV